MNDFDLAGTFGWKAVANIASIGSMIPGPIGMAAAGVAAVSYAAAGDKKQAMIAAAGIALAAVGAGGAVVAYKGVKVASTAKAISTTTTVGTKAAKGTYSVYHGVDAAGVVRYVGITKRNPVIRFGEHARNPEKAGLSFTTVHSNLSKSTARKLEQGYIDRWGMQKNGGKLINKINSIRKR